MLLVSPWRGLPDELASIECGVLLVVQVSDLGGPSEQLLEVLLGDGADGVQVSAAAVVLGHVPEATTPTIETTSQASSSSCRNYRPRGAALPLFPPRLPQALPTLTLPPPLPASPPQRLVDVGTAEHEQEAGPAPHPERELREQVGHHHAQAGLDVLQRQVLRKAPALHTEPS